MHRSARVIIAMSALLVLVSGLSAVVGLAAPVESPRIEVFLDAGVTPVGTTVIHPGDELVVRGYGFDPNLADPVLRVDGERGAEPQTSTTNTNGTDVMRRIESPM